MSTMSIKVKVRVPATTANMGPGFDCLGMALTLYNEAEFEVAAAGTGGGESRTPEDLSGVTDSKNLVCKSFVTALLRFGVAPKSVSFRMLKTGIPVARGLGSSAACIVAGVLAAREAAARLGAGRVGLGEAIDLATEIEGHPDNVVPAILGGITVAVCADEPGGDLGDVTQRRESRRVICRRLEPPKDIALAAFVPDFRLSTEEARAALPATYSRHDAVFNISRAALLTASLATGDLTSLRTAVDDRIHQPYRLPLIAHSKDVIEAARAAGSEAEFVSGSGPTIMAVLRGDGDGFAQEVSRKLAAVPGGWALYLLKPDDRGAVVSVE